MEFLLIHRKKKKKSISPSTQVRSGYQQVKKHMMAGVTLSYKCLAGVEENLAALHDHALNCQVLPDVFSLTHFIMHDSREKGHFIVLI